MITFVTNTPAEQWRVKTLFTKEPGTVRWIQETVTPHDVFYDIGANIGQYALMAAQRGASVVAFEPHLFNAVSLIRNVQKNKASVRVITSALHDEDCFLPFNYLHTMAGSSGSQLGHTVAETGETFVPALIEMKHATTVDRLVREGVILPPTVVKIDVDGNELTVLRGMTQALASVRSLQVEMHPRSESEIANFLVDFRKVERHYTAFGQQQIDKGIDTLCVFSNVIYERAA